MTNLPYLLATLLIGMIFSQQPAINAVSAKGLGSPVAGAALSISVTLICLLVLLPFSGGTLRPSAVAALPWWVVFGGVIGGFVVAGGAAIAPITGAALFFIFLVAGQLLGAAAADHFGAFGLPERPLSLTRAAGLALVIAGALLVRRG